MQNNEKSIVIFGAGKIGRSFIGQVFGKAGYQIIFIDINTSIIELLNQKRKYKIVIKSNAGDSSLYIDNLKGIDLSDQEKVAEAVSNAHLVSLSVGQQGLPSAIPLLAEGLQRRRKVHGEWPLDIIIAENMRNTDAFIKNRLKELLGKDFPVENMTGLIETSIGKMVPVMTIKDMKEDPLQIFAEPYNDLIVSRSGFKNNIPQVRDLHPKANIKAWVDRKLFVHNLGHSSAAYLGFAKNSQYRYIYECMEDAEVREQTLAAMYQSAEILQHLYPGEFSDQHLNQHINDLLERFANRALKDTIFRVGCDLYRKLGPEDRFTTPLNGAFNHHKKFNHILKALRAGFLFRATDEQGNYFPGDISFFEEAKKGEIHILKNICRFSDEFLNVITPLFHEKKFNFMG
ncbi:MAG: mannitol-1-phosphate 5-dehydrogenase [Bacteroidota bacterium]